MSISPTVRSISSKSLLTVVNCISGTAGGVMDILAEVDANVKDDPDDAASIGDVVVMMKG